MSVFQCIFDEVDCNAEWNVEQFHKDAIWEIGKLARNWKADSVNYADNCV